MSDKLTLDKREASADFVKFLNKHYQTDEDMKYIVSLALAAVLNKDEIKPVTPVGAAFIVIDGKDFRCPCGSNLFTKMSDDTFHCNICPNQFEGE